ncbi:MAG TPA: alpha/beta hydrolase [Acidimicrobiales bacterium]|jgi:pimeloyl-ACP methyl ester carboxylesterase
MSTTTSKDGTSIAYERFGHGPTIILVDGATAYRAINPVGAQLAELLGSDFTVVTYDRRGRGESGDTPPYAVEREVEDLAALIAELGGSAYVVGHSSGAVLALEAAKQGLPIDKVVMYEPPFVIDDSRPVVPETYVADLDDMVAAGRRGDAVEYFMTKAVGLPPEFLGPMRQDPSFAALEAVAHTIAYDGRIMGDTLFGDPSSVQRWSDVKVPTVVVDGGASDTWIHFGADTLAHALPNAERRTLEGQTHSVAPDALAPVLREVLAS